MAFGDFFANNLGYDYPNDNHFVDHHLLCNHHTDHPSDNRHVDFSPTYSARHISAYDHPEIDAYLLGHHLEALFFVLK